MKKIFGKISKLFLVFAIVLSILPTNVAKAEDTSIVIDIEVYLENAHGNYPTDMSLWQPLEVIEGQSVNYEPEEITGYHVNEERSVLSIEHASSDTSIQVYYERNEYVVQFQANGGTGQMNDQAFVYGVPQKLKNNHFSRDYFDFLGWATSSTSNTVVYANKAEITVDSNLNLFAVWKENTVKMNYSATTGGKVSPTSTTVGIVTGTGNTASVASENTGYKFINWQDSNNQVVSNEKSFTPSPVNGLYRTGNYKAYFEPLTATVIFNSNGGEGSMDNVDITYNVSSNAPTNTFTKPGYSFLGWSTNSEATSVMVANGGAINTLATNTNIDENGHVTLYAIWKSLGNATIKYTVDSATKGTVTLAQEVIDVYSGNPVGSTAQPKANYVFVGWFANGAGANATPLSTDLTFVPSRDPNTGLYVSATYQARFKGAEYKVIYDKGNIPAGADSQLAITGTMDDTTAIYGSNVTLRDNAFQLNGATFNGWNTKADGTGISYANKAVIKNYSTSGNLTLYAQWKENTVEITYYGSITPNDSTVNPGNDDYVETIYAISGKYADNSGRSIMGVTANPPVGFENAQWINEATNEVVATGLNFVPTVSEDTHVYQAATYYPRFVPSEYVVEYYSHEGELVKYDTVKYDETYTIWDGSTLSRPGYSLYGWVVTYSDNPDEINNDYSTNAQVVGMTAGNTIKLMPKWYEFYTTYYYSYLGKGSIRIDEPNNTALLEMGGSGSGNFKGLIATPTSGYKIDSWQYFDNTLGQWIALPSTVGTITNINASSQKFMPSNSEGEYKGGKVRVVFAPKEYRIIYNPGDGQNASGQTGNQGAFVDTISHKYTDIYNIKTIESLQFSHPDGLEFDCWKAVVDGKEITIYDGQKLDKLTTDATVTLTAQWAETYTRFTYMTETNGIVPLGSVVLGDGTTTKPNGGATSTYEDVDKYDGSPNGAWFTPTTGYYFTEWKRYNSSTGEELTGGFESVSGTNGLYIKPTMNDGAYQSATYVAQVNPKKVTIVFHFEHDGRNIFPDSLKYANADRKVVTYAGGATAPTMSDIWKIDYTNSPYILNFVGWSTEPNQTGMPEDNLVKYYYLVGDDIDVLAANAPDNNATGDYEVHLYARYFAEPIDVKLVRYHEYGLNRYANPKAELVYFSEKEAPYTELQRDVAADAIVGSTAHSNYDTNLYEFIGWFDYIPDLSTSQKVAEAKANALSTDYFFKPTPEQISAVYDDLGNPVTNNAKSLDDKDIPTVCTNHDFEKKFYAVYRFKDPVFNVIYHTGIFAENGKEIGKIVREIHWKDTLDKPTDIIVPGYEIVDWYSDESLEDKWYFNGDDKSPSHFTSIMPSHDLHLYAELENTNVVLEYTSDDGGNVKLNLEGCNDTAERVPFMSNVDDINGSIVLSLAGYNVTYWIKGVEDVQLPEGSYVVSGYPKTFKPIPNNTITVKTIDEEAEAGYSEAIAKVYGNPVYDSEGNIESCKVTYCVRYDPINYTVSYYDTVDNVEGDKIGEGLYNIINNIETDIAFNESYTLLNEDDVDFESVKDLHPGMHFKEYNTAPDGSGAIFTPEMDVINLCDTEGAEFKLYTIYEEDAVTIKYEVAEESVGYGSLVGIGTNSQISSELINAVSGTYYFNPSKSLVGAEAKALVDGYEISKWAKLNEDGTYTFLTANDSDTTDFPQTFKPKKNAETGVYEAATYVAFFDLETYTVVFDGNKGTSNTEVTGTMEDQVITCATTTPLNANQFARVGYTFAGWNTKADGSGTSYANKAKVKDLTGPNEKITLYAQWTASTNYFEVLYYLEGANGTFALNSSHSLTGSKKVSSKTDTFIDVNTSTYSKYKKAITGYIFDETNPNNVLSGYVEGNPSSNPPKLQLKLYYKLIELTIVYDRNLNSVVNNETVRNSLINNEQIPDQKFKYGLPRTVNATGYTVIGYTQTSWNSKPDGKGTSYSLGQTTSSMDADSNNVVHLYAVYTPNKYTITYVLNGGKATGNPTSYSIVDIDKEIVINDATKTGYIFDGWTGEEFGSTLTKNPDAKFTVTLDNLRNRTYTANFTAIKYNVQFDPNSAKVIHNTVSGDMDSINNISYDQQFKLPKNNYSAYGYTFAGWNTKADGTGTNYADEASVKNLTATNGSTVTLYAKWVADKYNIVYENTTGASPVSGSLVSTYTIEDNAITIPDLKKTGYTFNGWSSNDTNPAIDKELGYVFVVDKTNLKDITFRANFTNNTYTIEYRPGSFKGNPGQSETPYSTPEPQTCTYDKDVTLRRNTFGAPNPSDELHFVGWCKNENGTGTIYPEGQPTNNLTPTDGDTVVLYAIWQPNEYKINFILNDSPEDPADNSGNAGKDSYNYFSDPVTIVKMPSREGYSFWGWHDKDATNPDERKISYTIPTGSKGDKTYEAFWSPQLFDIFYVLNGGSFITGGNYPDKYKVTYPDFIISPVEREGYRFKGWTIEWEKNPSVNGKTVYELSVPEGSVGQITLTANWEKSEPNEAQFIGQLLLTGDKSNADIKADQFHFTITEGDGTHTNPIGGVTNLDALLNNPTVAAKEASGSFEYPVLTFTAAGDWYFTISQVDENKAGYTYDNNDVTVHVHVTYDASIGKYVAETTYTKNGENDYLAEFVTTYTNPDPIKLDLIGNKEISGGHKNANDVLEGQFEFTVTDDSNNDKTGYTYTAGVNKTAAGGSIDLGNISFNKQGVYKFVIAETPGNELGYTYDSNTFNLTVTVTLDEDTNTLSKTEEWTRSDASDYDGIKFINEYIPLPCKSDPPVEKKISGTTPTSNDPFRFIFEAKDATYPMPEGSENGKKIATIYGSGWVEFGEMEFDHAGTYEYTISEINDHLPGYTYDETKHTVVYEVTDVGGMLEVVRKIDGNEDGTIVSIEIENEYHVPGKLTVSKQVIGKKGSKDIYFNFTFNIDIDGEYPYTLSDGTTGIISSGDSFQLKHGDSIEIADLPTGANYLVTEDKVAKYRTKMTGNEGQILEGETAVCEFINTDKSIPETGDDSSLYNYLMLISLVGLSTVFVIKRKKQYNY